MSAKQDYWSECIAIAAEECGLTLTPEQLECLADGAERGHEYYGDSFYSPPDGDRIGDVEREWKAKVKALEDEHARYVRNAEAAVKLALGTYDDAVVSIESHGEVLRHGGGLPVRIQ